MMLHSAQIERHCLGGLLQNPEIFADVEPFLNERSFHIQPHGVIYACLKSILINGEKPEPVFLSEKIKNLGINFKENINIFDYIEALSLAPITSEATIKACKEVAKLNALRKLNTTGDRMKEHVAQSVDQSLDKTIAEIDAIYSETIKSFDLKNDVEDLFSSMLDEIEETGNNPVDEIGIPTPFNEFNRLYGGIRDGNVYIIVSRPKQGKTTFLNYFAHEISRIHQIPVLILDTEMSSKEIRFRTAASITNVPLWYLETGNWRKNPNYFDKIRDKQLKERLSKYKVHHIAVGNMPTERVISIIRRWHMRFVGRGNKSVVFYDYLKLTGEKLGQNWAEHQALGDKVTAFKELGVELGFPFVSAGQMNRSGENIGRQSNDVADDGSVVAISDRLNWFATFVGIFRTKTPDEFTLDTPESGTHKLIQLFARYQGRDAVGHQDWVWRKMPDGEMKLVRNYLNFDIKNFSVTERGSLQDSIIRQNAMLKIEDPHGDANETL